MYRYIFILFAVLLSVRALAQEPVRVEGLYDYAFSDSAAMSGKEE